MTEKRRLKAGIDLTIVESLSGHYLQNARIDGRHVATFVRTELEAISDLVPEPPPNVRERLRERIQDSFTRLSTHAWDGNLCGACGNVADTILADLGLDADGKRAMPDDAETRRLLTIWHLSFDNLDSIHDILKATGHYAEPGK